MNRRVAVRLAWGLWALNVLTVASLMAWPVRGAGPLGSAAGAVFIVVFATTGALVASRIPGNPIGWLLCLAALAFTIGGVSVQVSGYAFEERIDHPVVTVAAWVGTFVWILGIGPAATFVFLLFPDGRLPSPRWRPVAWLAGGALAAVVVGLALTPGRIEDTRVTNPVGVAPGTVVMDLVSTVGLALLFVSILACCLSLVVRYRAARQERRQQLKWIAWSLPVVLLWLAASIWVESTQTGETSVDVANMLSSVGLTVVPVAIAVAILRHRLYDIDLVIKSTLVYGALTAALVATYMAAVLVLQLTLRPLTSDSELAVAGSTLAVAALFRPLRSRIQSVVDRRFFRARYDAARTLETFAIRLRDELDIESLDADLRRVVNDTMKPAHVSLWLRGAP